MKVRLKAAPAALGVLLGIGHGCLFAQQFALPPLPPATPRVPAAASPARPVTGLTRVAYQDAAPAPPGVPAPTTPEAVAPGTLPSAASGATPLSTNTDLSLPRSEREGGGGEPTEATAAADEAAAPPEKDPTKLLMNALGLEESKVKVYGWIQNSYTGNANGKPKNGLNFGVNPNFLANSWMGNQYYIIVEKPLEQSDKINFGFRVDNLFGNDWQFNHMQGLNDNQFKLNSFNGYDPAQMYAEVHIPKIGKGGTDVKGGRFYTILGYEVVPATGRPLLSVPYMFNYGQPFTHFGFLATTHVTDRINWYNGAVNGWDRWINENYKWNYLGGWTWTSKDTKAALAMSYIVGPNQFPRFLPANQQIYPTGYSPPGYRAGQRNPRYGGNDRTTFTTVFTYKWTDTFTQVMETDQSIEKNVPGYGPNGAKDAQWYSFGNWFLWQMYKPEGRGDVLTSVWRSEVFRDSGGIRTGFSDNFYEMTLGLIYKPVPYLWVRPEARYDWAQFKKPYNDGTRGSQFTLAVDVILLF